MHIPSLADWLLAIFSRMTEHTRRSGSVLRDPLLFRQKQVSRGYTDIYHGPGWSH
jgi:hypothetical protein